ncbi:probable ATP-dependent helicase DinG homolog [Arthrobacter sp. Hiyo8]|nr:probable ATP-dependent helicase DinG homolog [Arthrobacter sp. Hiyo8]
MGGQNRTGQHQMARQVARAIETGEHLLVQAGTGTGKSLAYLIPLIAHSMESNKPTLVSTATLALQTQIVGRDLPRLLETINPELDRPVSIALVKGRANYVCRHKLEGGFPSEEPAEGSCSPLARTPAFRIWPQPSAGLPRSLARKSCGCVNGRRRPRRGTATNSCRA